MGVLKVKVDGEWVAIPGSNGTSEEVAVGPTDPGFSYDLWYDTDAVAPPPGGGDGGSGSTIINGVGPPTDDIGNPGDYYLDTDGGILYGPKQDAVPPQYALVNGVPLSFSSSSQRNAMKYRFLKAGEIIGCRFYRDPNETPTPRAFTLWNSANTAVATSGLTVESGSPSPGYFEAMFPTPISVNPNDEYMVSFDSVAFFAYTAVAPTVSDATTFTHVSSQFGSRNPGSPPTSVVANYSYFIDPIFRATGAGDVWEIALSSTWGGASLLARIEELEQRVSAIPLAVDTDGFPLPVAVGDPVEAAWGNAVVDKFHDQRNHSTNHNLVLRAIRVAKVTDGNSHAAFTAAEFGLSSIAAGWVSAEYPSDGNTTYGIATVTVTAGVLYGQFWGWVASDNNIVNAPGWNTWFCALALGTPL